MPNVSSTLISNVEYDADSQKLQVTFMSGATWEYSPVSALTYQEMLSAPSVGKFFLTQVKGRYEGEEV